jgi:hypothetical protein
MTAYLVNMASSDVKNINPIDAGKLVNSKNPNEKG